MNQLNNLEVPAKGAVKRAVLLNGASDLQAAKGKKRSSSKPASSKAPASKGKAAGPSNPGQPNRPRAKQDLLIQMLQSKNGATIDEIVKATDWQPHSARAMISGLRKASYQIELGRNKDDEAVYRIVSASRRKSK